MKEILWARIGIAVRFVSQMQGERRSRADKEYLAMLEELHVTLPKNKRRQTGRQESIGRVCGGDS